LRSVKDQQLPLLLGFYRIYQRDSALHQKGIFAIFSHMAEIKTKKTSASVKEFIDAVSGEERRSDAKKLLAIFKRATGLKPAMWGASMVGYGAYHYQSEKSSQKGDWPLTAFSPRKANLTIYIMPGFSAYDSLLQKLGPHSTGSSCLYVKSLDGIHIPTLELLIKKSVADMKKKYKAA
jgi:hypothetical protein